MVWLDDLLRPSNSANLINPNLPPRQQQTSRPVHPTRIPHKRPPLHLDKGRINPATAQPPRNSPSGYNRRSGRRDSGIRSLAAPGGEDE
jgi:hypothetical protein